MLDIGSYKFVIVADKGTHLSSCDIIKSHKQLAFETGQKAIAGGIIKTFKNGTYEIEQHFSDSLQLYDFTPEHRAILARYMHEKHLMTECG